MSPVVVALPDWDFCPSHGPLALGVSIGLYVSTLLVFLGVGPLWKVCISFWALVRWISCIHVHSGHQANPSSFHTAWPAKPHSKWSRQSANRKKRVKRVKMRKWQVLDANGCDTIWPKDYVTAKGISCSARREEHIVLTNAWHDLWLQ